MARETSTFFSESSIELEYAQSDRASIVKASIDIGDFDSYVTYSASGTSKREPGDKRDGEVGFHLALARALESLAAKLVAEVKDRAYPKPSDGLMETVSDTLMERQVGLTSTGEPIYEKYASNPWETMTNAIKDAFRGRP